MSQINQDALGCLRSAGIEKPWAGKRPSTWIRHVVGGGCASDLTTRDEPMSRLEVRAFSGDESRSSEDLFIAICAWGGMTAKNGRLAWAARANWIPVLNQLRSGQLDRRAAYRLFYALQRDRKLPGVGPAYFTKLIFFIRPDLNGYILDQWLARSINLLFEPRIKLVVDRQTHRKTVSNVNDAEAYEWFCLRVEEVAAYLGVTPPQAEERMFSSGGRRAGKWRAYVRAAT